MAIQILEFLDRHGVTLRRGDLTLPLPGSRAGAARIYSLVMAATPPGWYRDPGGSASWRWWDGSRWTEHLMAYSAAGPAAGRANDWSGSVRSAAQSEARPVPMSREAG